MLVVIPLGCLLWWPNVTYYNIGAWRHLGWPLAIAGIWIYGWSAVDFVKAKIGVPNFFRTPEGLVATGPYRLVRNPMYVGCLAVFAAEALLLPTSTTIAWGVQNLAVLLAWVRFKEEPSLRKHFGARYLAYCAQVPRWLPRLSPPVLRR